MEVTRALYAPAHDMLPLPGFSVARNEHYGSDPRHILDVVAQNSVTRCRQAVGTAIVLAAE
jgi:hypothetical protein